MTRLHFCVRMLIIDIDFYPLEEIIQMIVMNGVWYGCWEMPKKGPVLAATSQRVVPPEIIAVMSREMMHGSSQVSVSYPHLDDSTLEHVGGDAAQLPDGSHILTRNVQLRFWNEESN